jgi:hypothetical protein
MSSILRDVYFWLAIFLLSLADIFFIGTFLDWFDFGFVLGPYRFNHWLGWIGFVFILIHVPLFMTVKRRYVNKIKLFLGIHVVGNLLAYLLITIHFASQISRSAQFYPDLGTGVTLYVFMATLVTTGFLQRFGLLNGMRKSWRFLHTSSVLALFVIIVIHILHGVELL